MHMTDNQIDQQIDALNIHEFEVLGKGALGDVTLYLSHRHPECDRPVCDVEEGDTLDVLVRTAMNHTCHDWQPMTLGQIRAYLSGSFVRW